MTLGELLNQQIPLRIVLALFFIVIIIFFFAHRFIGYSYEKNLTFAKEIFEWAKESKREVVVIFGWKGFEFRIPSAKDNGKDKAKRDNVKEEDKEGDKDNEKEGDNDQGGYGVFFSLSLFFFFPLWGFWLCCPVDSMIYLNGHHVGSNGELVSL